MNSLCHREGRDDCYTYYSDVTVIQTNNEELYLYNNDITYYVITCNSAFEYNNDVTYYVITRNNQWTLGLERIHQVTNTIRIAIQGGEYDTYREYTFYQRLN